MPFFPQLEAYSDVLFKLRNVISQTQIFFKFFFFLIIVFLYLVKAILHRHVILVHLESQLMHRRALILVLLAPSLLRAGLAELLLIL